MTDREVIAEIINDLRRVCQVVNESSKRAERETGLTWPQFWAMKMVADHGPLRVSRLAERMYLHPATVVGILDRLEARNFVRRVRSPEDRRVVEVHLTDLGDDVIATSPQAAHGVLVPGLEKVPVEDLAVISAGLARMARLLHRDEVPPGPEDIDSEVVEPASDPPV